MSRDKQIRNMAEEILQEYTNCYSEVDQECLEKMLGKLASEVAREIFEEIESKLMVASHIDNFDGKARIWLDDFYELKKKYESEGEG